MLTDDEIDVLGASVVGQSHATAEHIRAIARAVEREAYRRAAAECKKIEEWYLAAYKGLVPTAPHMHNNPYIEEKADSGGECAAAIEALGRED